MKEKPKAPDVRRRRAATVYRSARAQCGRSCELSRFALCAFMRPRLAARSVAALMPTASVRRPAYRRLLTHVFHDRRSFADSRGRRDEKVCIYRRCLAIQTRFIRKEGEGRLPFVWPVVRHTTCTIGRSIGPPPRSRYRTIVIGRHR